MNAQTTYQLETKPECVLADGPYEVNGDGDCEYCVCFGDDTGDAITENAKAIWYLSAYEEVLRFGAQLAEKFGLEFINEASRP